MRPSFDGFALTDKGSVAKADERRRLQLVKQVVRQFLALSWGLAVGKQKENHPFLWMLYFCVSTTKSLKSPYFYGLELQND